MGDAEINQIFQVRDRAVEGALWAEGADVEFIEDRAGFGRAAPQLIVPLVGGVVVQLRHAVHAVLLAQAAGIGVGRWVVVNQKSVAVAALGFGNGERPPAAPVRSLHGQDLIGPLKRHALRFGRPNSEPVHCVWPPWKSLYRA